MIFTLEFQKGNQSLWKDHKVDIINLFSFTSRNNILEWGEKFVQDHPNCTFEELEQTFYKHFQTMKNDEEIQM